MDLHEVESIAKQELLKHGLTSWSFAWAKTKRRQGVCKYRSRRIEIAEYYARHNPREKVLDTLMHEIAHRRLAMVRSGKRSPPSLERSPEPTTPVQKPLSCPATGRQHVRPAAGHFISIVVLYNSTVIAAAVLLAKF